MKKIRAIIWAIWIKLSAPFRRKYTQDQAMKTLVNDFGYKGQFRKPFSNAKPYEYSLTDGSVREVIRIGDRAFMSPNTILIWASNLKNAEKKASKL